MRSFPCDQCGANVEFSPGAVALVCPYCSAENKIPQSEADISELDFHASLAKGQSEDTVEQIALKCDACGASVTMGANVTADRCAFCDAPMVAESQTRRLIKPGSLLPFKITEKDAQSAFEKWLSGLWFAPSDLARRARAGKIDGTYLPFWTYDANTKSFYRGARGDYYYETEVYTTTENGEQVQKEREVRKTDWTPTSGTVWVKFDDILVLASSSIPEPMTRKLEPWDLSALVPYDDAYLSGFSAECYQLPLDKGFEQAKRIGETAINSAVRDDIGGDTQRINSIRSSWYDITYKHVLLPVWISAYRYQDKPFQFLVNARTGEVQGARPYSVVKIGIAVLVGLLVIAVIVYLMSKDGGGS